MTIWCDLSALVRHSGSVSGIQRAVSGLAGGLIESRGARSLRYGTTRDNVISLDAVLADGSRAHFGTVAPDLSDLPASSPLAVASPSVHA
mgnify:CR=1 FL=1